MTGTARRDAAAASAGRLPWPADAAQSAIAPGLRWLLLATAAVVGPLTLAGEPATLACLVVVFVLALTGTRRRGWAAVLLHGEAIAASVGILASPDRPAALLLCLPATAIGVGLARGYAGWLTVSALIAAFLPLGQLRALLHDGPADPLGVTARWVLVTCVVGLLAAVTSSVAAGSTRDRYAEAHRLLGQLRSVTRGLPGSLDPGSVGRTLLDECIALAGCEHGAVLLNVGGDQLVPLAVHGYQRVPWRATLAHDGPISRAWLSGTPVLDLRTADPGGRRRGSALLVVPVTLDAQRIGVVALESRRLDVFTAERQTALLATVGRFALPLETAALFDELRLSAAAEERGRLAQEMHDGIAQDLAFLGYELDALVMTLRAAGLPEPTAEAVRLRGHITGLMSDLRLSITDLRSSIGPGRGLGAALTAYARSAGTSSGITVHVSLTEGSTRLAADAEVQLLRIAHEAVGAARRRPGVRNLWIVLVVDPPSALLVVEDDGPLPAGDAPLEAGADMTARAGRLGADFRLERRLPTGVRVCVAVGTVQGDHGRAQGDQGRAQRDHLRPAG